METCKKWEYRLIYSNRTVMQQLIELSSHFIVDLLLNSARPHLKLMTRNINTNWSGLKLIEGCLRQVICASLKYGW